MSSSNFQIREVGGRLLLFDDQGQLLTPEDARKLLSALMDAYPWAGYVYLAEKFEDDSSIFKIGMTGQVPSKRLNQIRFDESDPSIALVHLIECTTLREARDLERQLHDFFRLQQVRGEWFELSPQDVAWLCSQLSAPVDFNSHAIMPAPDSWGKLPWTCVPKRFYSEVYDAVGNRIFIGATEVARMFVRVANATQHEQFNALVRLVRREEGDQPDDYDPAQAMTDLQVLREFVDHAADVMQKGGAQ